MLVVLAAAGMAVLRLGGSAEPAAGQGALALALDMNVSNGSGPCDPIDDSADRALGESYQVAICVGGLQQAVAVFSATVLYDDYLNFAPEISCTTNNCLDDNPDANAGATTWGDGLGEGWDCNILGAAEPTADKDLESGPGQGEAFIACLSGAGLYRLGDNETWGVLAVINFQTVAAGVDSLSFGDASENTLGDSCGVEMGTCGASKDISCSGGTVNISMTPAPSPTPTTTPTPTPTSTPGAPTPDPSLVAHWKLDEGSGTAAADSSGNGNAGALYGPTWVAGRDGSALHFDGTDDYVEVPDDDTLDLTTGAAVAAGVRVDGTTGYVQELVSKWFACPGEWKSAWAFEMESNGVTAGWGTTIGTGFDMLLSNSTVPLGTWFHYAATFDGSVKKVYIDGQETASRAVPGTLGTNSNPLQLGRNAYDTCYPEQRYWFKGTVDDVRIYNRALTAQEIRDQVGISPVGGMAEFPHPDTHLSAGSDGGASPSVSATAILGIIAGGVALALALAVWRVRRRRAA
ncbi:MAG: LamG domain-containing protein [Dehalococcoidia bacterium]|nr:LamG domain-containing protein [Dehalococcoidia bacterium]